jgi:hypothetical protein
VCNGLDKNGAGLPAGRRAPGRLGTSLADFVGNPAYGSSQLREDLDRFTFLPGGNDGEAFLGLSR